MIRLEELRIGNWFRNQTNNRERSQYLFRVKSLGEKKLVGFRDNGNGEFSIGSYKYKDVEPIPLTPEILEKCGFVKHMEGFQYRLGLETYDYDHRALVFTGDYLYLWEMDGSTNELMVLWNKDIKKEFFLHQLQNLYCALTGKELEIAL